MAGNFPGGALAKRPFGSGFDTIVMALTSPDHIRALGFVPSQPTRKRTGPVAPCSGRHPRPGEVGGDSEDCTVTARSPWPEPMAPALPGLLASQLFRIPSGLAGPSQPGHFFLLF